MAGPSHDERLDLMRAENRLVEALFAHPGTLDRKGEDIVRYALGLAALGTFQPGAAAIGKRTGRPDVVVRAEPLEAFRRQVFADLVPALVRTRDERRRLEALRAQIHRLHPAMHRAREAVLARHVSDFSPSELDDEIGKKTIVSIAGGGGGAGYVYIGAWELLQQAGLVPGYVVGASIGAVLGLFRSLRREGDFDDYMAFAKSVRYDELFRVMSFKARYGLPGTLRLFLHAAIGSRFVRPDGSKMTLSDLEIPFETIVAGIRRGAMKETPGEYALSHHLPEDVRPGPLQLRAQIASQLVRMVSFLNPKMVREIVIGSDALTRGFDCIDAAGFSAAIPGVLHYDVSRPDARMHDLLSTLLRREDVVALIDGGVANNVPSDVAYRRVQEGVVGTRNVYYLAFDCFHPQTTLGHIALNPVQRIVSLQVARNRRYAHKRIRFTPTLSPMHLLPSEREMDRAVGWGRAQMAHELPMIEKHVQRATFVPSPTA